LGLLGNNEIKIEPTGNQWSGGKKFT